MGSFKSSENEKEKGWASDQRKPEKHTVISNLSKGVIQ